MRVHHFACQRLNPDFDVICPLSPLRSPLSLLQISIKDGQDVAKEFGVRFFEVCAVSLPGLQYLFRVEVPTAVGSCHGSFSLYRTRTILGNGVNKWKVSESA